ncbi:MAG: hypothetical protein R3F36_07365 [Candidatus Competibacteraceae bacterium]
MVTEYFIEAGDTLCGRLLAEIACGYGVTPLIHRPREHTAPTLFPANELRLDAGDQLRWPPSIAGTESSGAVRAPDCQVLVEKVLNADVAFAGGKSHCADRGPRTLAWRGR